MWGRQVSLSTMAEWCNALGAPLRAGLTLKEALRLSAKRGNSVSSRLSAGVLIRLDEGDDLHQALKAQPEQFPALFMALAQVGEKTGNFPEILRELENYFRFQLKLRREFLAQIVWPVLQLILAILIIAVVILILGMIGTGPSGRPAFDPVGLGLFGASGAIIWLVGCFGSIAFLVVLYWLLRHVLGQGGRVDGFLLRVPVLGECLRTLAMARLCLGMRLTMDSSLPLKKSIPLSLEATDNGAFTTLTKPIVSAIHKGRERLHDAFAQHGAIFPAEFLLVLDTAEHSGSVPEEMGRLAELYNEQAKLRLALLNQAAGWLVWALVAALIIFLIFRMALSYINLLNSAVSGRM